MKIGITIGDPSGIGPELVLRAASKLGGNKSFRIFGNRKIFKKTAQDLHLLSGYRTIESRIIDATECVGFQYGKSTKKTARVAQQSIQACLESGADIMITAPIVKRTMRSIIPNFIGHTEYFAEFFRVRDYAMTGIWKAKRIMLLTTHIPLRPGFWIFGGPRNCRHRPLNEWGLKRYFGIDKPRIAVSAVNPHAFEFSLGEDETIMRAVIISRKNGAAVDGPFPADTLFIRNYDGYIAMYHDQAMVFLKSKKGGLNFTLGLPVIRLSPLCGAALDIAGRGCAEVSGFVEAVRIGKILYRNMRKYDGEN
jgi:4-hydroxythreonine-4-phosphate dehydrogenase